MASFTDAIPQFNPYIQQLPVDAMVAVGMQKQQQYDQGIQRIQSEIDRVAGLEIVRPQDREYLQSKLNDLGSKLRTVAAGDFSNFQLVNSVAGMAGKVAKDENVINAVQSTAQRKNLMQRMQTDIEKGNYNPANQYVFNVSDTEWFNNPNVGAKYTGGYKTPHDVWGKIRDIAKEVGIDEKTVQQLMETDSLGRTIYNEDGSPKWNRVMVEKTFKGRDASKILSAFESGLNASDYEQLSIEGRYKYRNASQDDLRTMITSSTNQKMEFNNGKIETLKLALSDETNKPKKDLQLIESIKNQIQYFENQNSRFKSSRDEGLKAIDQNPESVKSALFTNDYLSTMSKVLSSQDVSEKYSVNPLHTISMDISKFNQSVKQWEEEHKLRLSQEGRAVEKHAYEIAELKMKLANLTVDPTTGIPQGLEDVDKSTVVSMAHADLDEKMATVNQLNYEVALESMKDTNPRMPGESNEAYDRRLKVKLEEVAKVVNPYSGSLNEGVQKIATAKLVQWGNNPSTIPPTMKGVVIKQSNAYKDLIAYKSAIESSRRKADEIATTQGIDVDATKKAIASTKPVTVTLPGGRTKTLTAEDLVDATNAKMETFNLLGSWSMSKEDEKRKQQAVERLSRKFGADLPAIMSQLYKPGVPSNVGGSTQPTPIPAIREISSMLRSENIKAYNKIYADVLVENGALIAPMRYPITQRDLKESDFKNKFSTVLQNYQTTFPDQVNTAMASVVSGKFSGSVLVESGTSTSPNKYFLEMVGENGEPIAPIEITSSEYTTLTGNRPPVPSIVTGIQRKLYTDGTTNAGSSGDYNTSYFTADTFTNFSSDRYSLRGDLESDRSNLNRAFLKLYLIDKISGNLVDEEWVREDGEGVPFDLILEDGTPNMRLPYISSGFNKTNVSMFFNRPID
jgi:hypothetical protein